MAMSLEKDSEMVSLPALYDFHETVMYIRLSGCAIHYTFGDWEASADLSRGRLAAGRDGDLKWSGFP